MGSLFCKREEHRLFQDLCFYLCWFPWPPFWFFFWRKSWSCLSLSTFSSDCVVHAPVSLEPGLPWLCAQLWGPVRRARRRVHGLRGSESAEATVRVLPGCLRKDTLQSQLLLGKWGLFLNWDCRKLSLGFYFPRKPETNMRNKMTRKLGILSVHLFIPKFFQEPLSSWPPESSRLKPEACFCH